MLKLLLATSIALLSFFVKSQGCCSGGSGNPLSGAAATGVLKKGQIEVLNTYKFTRSNRFLSGDSDTASFFDNLTSNYLFLKTDYGISDKLTLSLATGYYLNRTITEFPYPTITENGVVIEQNKISSGGIGDLILFPRYSVYNNKNENSRTELTLGMGLKIPLGHHNDSNFVGFSKFVNMQNNPPTIDSVEVWQTSPPTIQSTTGSNDIMFYGFFSKHYPHRKLRFFASALYINKGWNSLGEKFGNYGSLGLFVSRMFFDKLSLVGQLKGEIVGRMKTHEEINVLSLYNVDVHSTGSKKLSFVPQIGYTVNKALTFFINADLPLYQYMNGMQIASQYEITSGISYRFNVKKPEIPETKFTITNDLTLYKESKFKVWGKCVMCKEKIESMLLKLNGVKTANWSIEAQMLQINYNENLIALKQINAALAKIGYDTETHKASNRAYKKLHSCCKYDRQ